MKSKHLINFQKQVAKDTYNKLKLFCHEPVLAGGAPRDWYHFMPCRDLDFYVTVPYPGGRYDYQGMTKWLFPADKYSTNISEGEEYYVFCFDIVKVITICSKDNINEPNIQLIFVPSVENLLEKFTLSLSQIKYNFSLDSYEPTTNYTLSVLTKKVFYMEDIVPNPNYIAKVARKYPQYTYNHTYKEAVDSLVHNSSYTVNTNEFNF